MTETDRKGAPTQVVQWLATFAERAAPGRYGVPWSHHFAGGGQTGDQAPHVVLGVITHGNEYGTLPAALRLQKELTEGAVRVSFPVTILLGNPEAARANERFLEEDFNRVMTFDRPANNLERRRAEEVRPLLDAADFFLDIHQTQTRTESAFWTMPWEGELGSWARALAGAPMGLTRSGGGSFSKGKCCLDEYVRARGRVGITVEVGEKGEDPEQAERAYRCMRRALAIHEGLASGQSLASQALTQPEVSWYATEDIVAAETPDHRLRPGIGNFTKVTRGELLSPERAPEIRASTDGVVLFPKYPRPGDPPPPELFRLGVPIDNPEAAFAKASS